MSGINGVDVGRAPSVAAIDPSALDPEGQTAAARLRGLREAFLQNPSGAISADGDRVELISAASIEPERVAWLWPGYLARGKIHVLAGSPGVGKTTLALAIAATISSGGRWPDGARAERGRVLIWSGEDDPADVLVPRLVAAGADLDRVHFVGPLRTIVDGSERRVAFDPAHDLDALADAIRNSPPRLLLIDPLVSAIAGDSHKNSEVRRGLQPLADLVRDLAIAAVGVTHLTKGTQGRDPVERVTGSLAFGAVARVVLIAAKNREGESPARILTRAKSNIGPDGNGFSFDIVQAPVPGYDDWLASVIRWGEPIEGAARDALAAAEAADDEDRSQTDDAADWLQELLRHGGVAASDAKRQAHAAGISDKALRSARVRLGVKPHKRSFGGGWWWCLPANAAGTTDEGAEDAREAKMPRRGPTHNEGTFDDRGHLRDATTGGQR